MICYISYWKSAKNFRKGWSDFSALDVTGKPYAEQYFKKNIYDIFIKWTYLSIVVRIQNDDFFALQASFEFFLCYSLNRRDFPHPLFSPCIGVVNNFDQFDYFLVGDVFFTRRNLSGFQHILNLRKRPGALILKNYFYVLYDFIVRKSYLSKQVGRVCGSKFGCVQNGETHV